MTSPEGGEAVIRVGFIGVRPGRLQPLHPQRPCSRRSVPSLPILKFPTSMAVSCNCGRMGPGARPPTPDLSCPLASPSAFRNGDQVGGVREPTSRHCPLPRWGPGGSSTQGHPEQVGS